MIYFEFDVGRTPTTQLTRELISSENSESHSWRYRDADRA
jgi:hypothetical protein